MVNPTSIFLIARKVNVGSHWPFDFPA